MKAWMRYGLAGALVGLVLWALPQVVFMLSPSLDHAIGGPLWSVTSPVCVAWTNIATLRQAHPDSQSMELCWLLGGHAFNMILFFLAGAYLSSKVGAARPLTGEDEGEG